MFGSPTYEQLEGKSIYDLIRRLQIRNEKLEAVYEAYIKVKAKQQMYEPIDSVICKGWFEFEQAIANVEQDND